ncbi:hypothetical protein GCM10020221_32830 [Streptomyces thioluteus]|uniref:Uncharacterized protein n=1 Tax=Streptomyces thioluteus TaxID=66431 RepID=A0ABN3X1C4_STRTU
MNNTVPKALKRSATSRAGRGDRRPHISEHGNVIDAPGLKSEHYEVFDCAMGERARSRPWATCA